MQSIFGESSQDNSNEWLSVADLMAGLMVVFLFIAIFYIRPLLERNETIKEIVRTWQENETEIHQALVDEFEEDLPKWGAEFDEEDKLLIRFNSPEVLFESGRAAIRPRYADILSDFFPRYIEVLEPFRDSIEEVRIEGHTSSDWRGSTLKDAYYYNMELSQARTRAVLRNVQNLSAVTEADRQWLRKHLTANGLSSSHLVFYDDGSENREKSRRVEFRVRTTTRTEIVKILEAVEEPKESPQ